MFPHAQYPCAYRLISLKQDRENPLLTKDRCSDYSENILSLSLNESLVFPFFQEPSLSLHERLVFRFFRKPSLAMKDWWSEFSKNTLSLNERLMFRFFREPSLSLHEISCTVRRSRVYFVYSHTRGFVYSLTKAPLIKSVFLSLTVPISVFSLKVPIWVLSLIVLGLVCFFLFYLRLPVSVFTTVSGLSLIVPISVYCL